MYGLVDQATSQQQRWYAEYRIHLSMGSNLWIVRLEGEHEVHDPLTALLLTGEGLDNGVDDGTLRAHVSNNDHPKLNIFNPLQSMNMNLLKQVNSAATSLAVPPQSAIAPQPTPATVDGHQAPPAQPASKNILDQNESVGQALSASKHLQEKLQLLLLSLANASDVQPQKGLFKFNPTGAAEWNLFGVDFAQKQQVMPTKSEVQATYTAPADDEKMVWVQKRAAVLAEKKEAKLR
ncbi:hypothetical protein FA15DRAFT_660967 [Coprinopsis marcescibilis]|uniref:Uncharacterized protein n=1 Tax=Coprinopsis marcescibilis TaxID=230819 RepID=A0A5C3KDM5_COPMA|nr:hypothetical protein FA15DRAFT_660967 [Coprinopsis marcescibilis]